MTPTGPLLLSSYAGLRSVNLNTGTWEDLSEEEVATRLKKSPFLDLGFAEFGKVEYRWDDGIVLGITALGEAFLYEIDEQKSHSTPFEQGENQIIGYAPVSHQLRIATLSPNHSDVVVQSYNV